jgi:hypothetical protein
VKSRAAAEAVHKLALRCFPIPEGLAYQARPYIDQHKLIDPHNGRKTLDGRDAGEAWGEVRVRERDDHEAERDALARVLQLLSVATGETADVAGHLVTRPHVGYWSLDPDPFGGDGAYPLELVADHLVSAVRA